MTATDPSFPPVPLAALSADSVPSSRLTQVLGWLALACLLVILAPLFVRMPLWADMAWYDICARHALQGGAVERDFLFLMPPGMAWALALVRSLLGWSSEAVRLVDLAIFSGIVYLLVAWPRGLSPSRARQVWAAVLLFGFYLTTSEWAHCQPDVWMLLPALGALHLRLRQVRRLHDVSAAGQLVVWGALEGVCWGISCLFKPYVVVPGLFTWIVSAILLRRSGRGWLSPLVCDAVGLLAGGLLMASLWQGWLIATGSWWAYWHNIATYRGEFYSTAISLWWRPLYLLFQMPPWGVLHLLAVPVSFGVLARAVLAPDRSNGVADPASSPIPLLAAFYLGWLVQSGFIAQAYDYHVVPTLLIALALIAGWLSAQRRLRWAWVWVALGMLSILYQPTFHLARIELWGCCWVDGGSPKMRDRLALKGHEVFATQWQDLKEIELFLKERGVGNRELLCYDATTSPLYLQLGVKPGTRFLAPSTFIYYLPSQRESIRAELSASCPRLVVIDRRLSTWYEGMAIGRMPEPDETDPGVISPQLVQRFPYSEPVVFRAGRYWVHEVRQTEPRQP